MPLKDRVALCLVQVFLAERHFCLGSSGVFVLQGNRQELLSSVANPQLVFLQGEPEGKQKDLSYSSVDE